jgi:acetyl esterase/lipase
LRGELKKLPRTSIYAGDYELFYPDLKKLYSKMKDAGVAVTLHQQPGGLHVYPLIPSPEGKQALNQLILDLLAE